MHGLQVLILTDMLCCCQTFIQSRQPSQHIELMLIKVLIDIVSDRIPIAFDLLLLKRQWKSFIMWSILALLLLLVRNQPQELHYLWCAGEEILYNVFICLNWWKFTSVHLYSHLSSPWWQSTLCFMENWSSLHSISCCITSSHHMDRTFMVLANPRLHTHTHCNFSFCVFTITYFYIFCHLSL